MSTIKVKVNGKLVEAKVEGNMRLLDLVRDTLHLTATKEGCSIGECGACTVLMDGNAVCSCLVLAEQCNEAEIETLEGLNDNPITQKLQNAFIERKAACSAGSVRREYWSALPNY